MTERRLVANRFQMDTLVGQGGMGEVYQGVDTQTGETVAVKLLKVTDNPALLERFVREAEALRRLNHPNIVKVLAFVQEGDQHYIVMEYVGGGALDDLLKRQPQLPVDQVLDIALDLADALTRAHRLKIIHRDIKPANVLLAADGTPRLTDFGVAHIEGRDRMTETGAVVGTYAYLSPEACHGHDLDDRTDVWSFGVMLYELLAGRRPFEAEQVGATITAILTQPPPDLKTLRPDVPGALAGLIRRMLEKDRDKRIPSVRQVGAELEAMMRGLDTPLIGTTVQVAPASEPPSRFDTPTPTPANTILLDANTGHHPQVVKTAEGKEYIVMPRRLARIPQLVLPILLILVILLAATLLNNRQNSTAETPAEATPAVQAVKPGEYMVLVAQVEHLGGPARDVSRFVADNLKQAFEVDAPFSNVRVRQYPQIVKTDGEALAAANATGATVIVWGNYNQEGVELQVQLGSLQNWPNVKFAREVLEGTINVRVKLTDERQQSTAQAALSVINVLQAADGNIYASMRSAATYQQFKMIQAEVVGAGVASHVHRHVRLLLTDTAGATEEINAALALDGGNALLYGFRSTLYGRTNNLASALRDAQTAQRLGPPDWVLPLYTLGGQEVFQGTSPSYDKIIALRPDDWFPVMMRGWMGTITGEADSERADLERAISLQPASNMPYLLGAMTAFHQARVADGVKLLNTAVHEFPDPTLGPRIIRAALGLPGELFAQYLALIGYVSLGQYETVVKDSQSAATFLSQAAVLTPLLGATGMDVDTKMFQAAINRAASDVYLMNGLAQCNLRQYAAAETAYSSGLKAKPDFTLLYLLRADARLKQKDASGAQADLAAARGSSQAAALEPFTAAVEARKLTCENFLGGNNPVVGGQ